jgi:hypothetical protein
MMRPCLEKVMRTNGCERIWNFTLFFYEGAPFPTVISTVFFYLFFPPHELTRKSGEPLRWDVFGVLRVYKAAWGSVRSSPVAASDKKIP